jgi:hypothetical protein
MGPRLADDEDGTAHDCQHGIFDSHSFALRVSVGVCGGEGDVEIDDRFVIGVGSGASQGKREIAAPGLN